MFLQRLARNTLINALKMYAVGGRKSKTVKDLIQNAERCVDSLRSTCFSEDERYSQLAEGLTEYWKLKQQMAHGSNPPWTQQILECASSFCVGSALCGAGAGGYAVIMSRGDYIDALADCVRSMNLQTSSSEHQLSIHSVTVDLDGLVCDVGLDTTIVPNMLLIN